MYLENNYTYYIIINKKKKPKFFYDKATSIYLFIIVYNQFITI